MPQALHLFVVFYIRFIFESNKGLGSVSNLVAYNHIIHLKWRATSLDLNTLEVEYFYFEPLSYTFWVHVYMSMARRPK